MGFPQSDLNKLLGQSSQELAAYHRKIGVEPRGKLQSDELSRLIVNLNQTQKGLQKVINEGRVTQIEPDKLKKMTTAITNLLNDASTLNKIEFVQDAISGASIPFFEELKAIMSLLATIEGLKGTRGGRASHIEEMGGG